MPGHRSRTRSHARTWSSPKSPSRPRQAGSGAVEPDEIHVRARPARAKPSPLARASRRARKARKARRARRARPRSGLALLRQKRLLQLRRGQPSRPQQAARASPSARRSASGFDLRVQGGVGESSSRDFLGKPTGAQLAPRARTQRGGVPRGVLAASVSGPGCGSRLLLRRELRREARPEPCRLVVRRGLPRTSEIARHSEW